MLIDGGIPIPGKPEEAPGRFAQALSSRDRLRTDRGRIFASREQAIRERSQGFTSTTIAAAEILAKRSLRPAEDGFSWYVDQRLKTESELRLTTDQIGAFVRAVRSPTLAILATRSPLTAQPGFVELLQQIPDIELSKIEGGHHFHLEDAVEEIANLAQTFLASCKV